MKEIQEKAFKSCYTADEWKKRKQAREQNEEYSKNPELYAKDKLKGKKCCVDSKTFKQKFHVLNLPSGLDCVLGSRQRITLSSVVVTGSNIPRLCRCVLGLHLLHNHHIPQDSLQLPVHDLLATD